jgi:hypothetical protein
LIYSLYDTFVTNARGIDDEFNTIPAAALTGLTYSVTRGPKTMAKSGLFGLAAAVVYLGLTKREELFNHLPMISNNQHRY